MDQHTNDGFGNKGITIIMIGILVILIVVLAIGVNIETNHIKKSGVYVIGKITGYNTSRGFSVFYTYNFAGHPYHEQTGVDLRKDSIRTYYLIKINPSTPTEGILLTDYCLGDSVRLIQPDSGWRENPMESK